MPLHQRTDKNEMAEDHIRPKNCREGTVKSKVVFKSQQCN